MIRQYNLVGSFEVLWLL